MNVPAGWYPSPVTWKVLPPAQPRTTVIWFCVSVPVLSEQMTVAQPSVSTAVSLRMSAWRLTIRCIPNARQMVTTAGSPSGTAAIARLTAIMNSSTMSFCSALRYASRPSVIAIIGCVSRMTPNTKMTPQIPSDTTPSHLPS